MKIKFILVFALIPFISFAQRDAVPYQVIQTKTDLPINDKTSDTEMLYPGNWLNIDSVIIYTVIDNGGFVAGTNVYGDLTKAQRFTVDKPGHIIGARYWIGVRDGEGDSLVFNIWSFNGSPGAVLASKVIPANQVEASLQLNNAFYVEFDEPVPVDGDFVVGIDMSGIGNTQVALVSSWDGEAGGLGLSWEKWSDGKWYTFLDPNGWDMDIDLAIFPIIMWDSEDPDPDPDPEPGQCGKAITFTYRGQQVTYGTVLKDYGGDIGQRCWMDRNLGASQVATASNDPLGYGDTFQWGRLDDGHQDRQSGKTSTPSNTDVPGHGNFITGAGAMSDWRSPQNDNLWQEDNGINNPCPSGWRIPTEAELNAERLSWGSNNSGGAFESSLKLTVGGYRNNSGSLVYVNSAGIYWTSDVSGGQAKYLNFQSNAGLMYFHGRTGGFSVRCVREETATADAPTVTTEAITGITTTTATGGGNVTSDGGAAVTARGICYSTSPNPSTADQTVQAGNGTGSFTAIMTGLTPGTTYYVRAYATNSVGTSYGSQVSFATSEEDPDPDPDPELPDLELTAVVNRHVSCFGGNDAQATANATGGVKPYTWLWSDGQTSQTASGLSAGIYQVTVTDNEGNTAATNATITHPDQLTVSATGTKISIHGGSDGTATAHVSGGTAPYTYLWNDNAAQTSQTANNLLAGPYTVSITDANGCSAMASISLIETDPDAITGIQVLQRADGSGLVDVGYNLSGEDDEYFVDLALSLDGGNTFFPVNPADVSGDFWPVSPGENKQLVFDARRVSPNASTSQARVMLTSRSGLIVTTTKVDHITFSTATMGGEVLADGGLEVTDRGIVFGTEPEPAISNPTAISLGAGLGSFSDNFTGLTPNITYYVRAWATNSQGTAYGNQETFTTAEEGPIVIHGPDGSRFVLPVEYLDFETIMSIEEHPFADILIPGQQAVSAALRIDIGNGDYVGGGNDYEIDIPVTIYDADPTRLRLVVRMTDGQLIQLPGEYDPEERRFSLKTLGLAHDWVVGVAMGSEIRSASSIDKGGDSDPRLRQIDAAWPTLNVVLNDVSQDEVRISQTVLNENVLPVARDVMITLQGGGFNAPELQYENQSGYQIILDNNVGSAYYGPQQGLLGKVIVGYQHFATDVSDPSTWQFGDVCIHETFHAVQYGYGTLEGVTGNYMFGRVNGAYKEGTATLIGATYETRGSIGKGAVHVRIKRTIDGPHDLGTVVDDIDPTPYDRQDFFAFLAKRYFEGDLTYTHGMFRSINVLAATMPTAVHNNDTKKLVFRKGLNHFLISKEKLLPEAYTEYALQRLYLHEPQYLLRGSEDPAFDIRFSKNRLAKHLLEKSTRHTNWKSSRNDTIHFNPIKFENLKSLASAAATLTVPSNVDPAFMPDTLSFSFALSGNASVNHMMREEGIRLLIIRAKDQHGTAVENNPMIFVENLDDPVKVPLAGGVTHLVFIAINAYVEDITTTIDIGITPEGTLVHNTTRNKWYDIIQDAVNEAVDGDVIEVHPGTYRSFRVYSKNITIRSAEGPKVTIIDGLTNPRRNAVDYNYCNGGEFSGFTIQNWGEGGLNIYKSTLSISNNIIRNNHNLSENVANASGIYAYDCHLIITDNVITNNIKKSQSGAGINIFMGSATIQNNIITDNQVVDGDGGGISVSEANATINRNTISRNSAHWGGGIQLRDGTGTIIDGNTINNNSSSADGGGIIVWDGTPIIKNNSINNNVSGQDGGGISVTKRGSSSNNPWPVIEGNTISNNHATQGGGVYGRASNWERTANIVVTNQAGKEIPMTVLRHMPCFTEPTNNYSGNTHRYSSWPPYGESWGPNGWCEDSGFHVKMW